MRITLKSFYISCNHVGNTKRSLEKPFLEDELARGKTTMYNKKALFFPLLKYCIPHNYMGCINSHYVDSKKER